MSINFSYGFQNTVSNQLCLEFCVCTHVSHLKTHTEVQYYEAKFQKIMFPSLLKELFFNSACFPYRVRQETTQVLRMLPYKPQ